MLGSKQLKKMQKHNKKHLEDVNKQLHNASNNKNSQIPHKMVQTIADQSKEAYPWVVRNVINKSDEKLLLNEQAKK